MSGHTQGPWALKQGKYGGPHEIQWAPGKSYGTVASVSMAGFQELPEALSDAERLANARLIAAAPEMLAALLKLVEAVDPAVGGLTLEDWATEPVADARAAIARATGEEVPP